MCKQVYQQVYQQVCQQVCQLICQQVCQLMCQQVCQPAPAADLLTSMSVAGILDRRQLAARELGLKLKLWQKLLNRKVISCHRSHCC